MTRTENTDNPFDHNTTVLEKIQKSQKLITSLESISKDICRLFTKQNLGEDINFDYNAHLNPSIEEQNNFKDINFKAFTLQTIKEEKYFDDSLEAIKHNSIRQSISPDIIFEPITPSCSKIKRESTSMFNKDYSIDIMNPLFNDDVLSLKSNLFGFETNSNTIVSNIFTTNRINELDFKESKNNSIEFDELKELDQEHDKLKQSIINVVSNITKYSLLFKANINSLKVKNSMLYETNLIVPSSGADSSLSNSNKRKFKGKYQMFTAEFKKHVVQYSNINGIKQACDKFDVPLKSLKRWILVGYERKKGGGRKSIDPIMEFKLLEWYANQKKNDPNFEIKSNALREKAIEFKSNKDFLASKGWFQKFIRKNKISFK